MADFNLYQVGDLVRLSADFRDDAGALADPTDVTLQVRAPAGTVTTLTGVALTKDALGRWHYDLIVDESGRWAYHWQGEGVVQVAREHAFVVQRSYFIGS